MQRGDKAVVAQPLLLLFRRFAAATAAVFPDRSLCQKPEEAAAVSSGGRCGCRRPIRPSVARFRLLPLPPPGTTVPLLSQPVSQPPINPDAAPKQPCSPAADPAAPNSPGTAPIPSEHTPRSPEQLRTATAARLPE